MARRPTKRRPARRSENSRRPYEEVAGLFERLAPDGWTPPATARLVAGRSGGTYTAVFVSPSGHRGEVFVRLRYDKSTPPKVYVAEEGMRFRWVLKGKVVR